jgi:hypothetical protein
MSLMQPVKYLNNPRCHQRNETGNEGEQTDFEFNAFRRDSTNRFGQQSIDEAASDFNRFSISKLGIEDPGREKAFKITFPKGTHT